MFLLMLHYVLIYLIDDLFLEGGATFSFNFYVLLLMCFTLYSTAWALSLLLNVNE